MVWGVRTQNPQTQTRYILHRGKDEADHQDIQTALSKTQKVVLYPTYESILNIIRENKGIAINYQNKKMDGISFLPLNIFDDYIIASVYKNDNQPIIKKVSEIIQKAHRL